MLCMYVCMYARKYAEFMSNVRLHAHFTRKERKELNYSVEIYNRQQDRKLMYKLVTTKTVLHTSGLSVYIVAVDGGQLQNYMKTSHEYHSVSVHHPDFAGLSQACVATTHKLHEEQPEKSPGSSTASP